MMFDPLRESQAVIRRLRMLHLSVLQHRETLALAELREDQDAILKARAALTAKELAVTEFMISDYVVDVLSR